MTNDELRRIAEIRKRDREMYSPSGSNLQMREDIHLLLKHLDEVLQAASLKAS